nr:ATP-binding protein [Cellulomonas hominis]
MLCLGATGSGKSVLLNWLATQAGILRAPAVIVDPKPKSDFTAVVEAVNGQVFSLDELARADGVFDPLRFSRNKAVGVELAASMIMSINPWGKERENQEVPLLKALNAGVKAGATCTGQALLLAQELGKASAELVGPIMDAAETLPMFRAMVGLDPQGVALTMHDGVTLIKVGDANLQLPDPNDPTPNITQRAALALVRMMVFGSAMALTNRNGMIMLDEAWVFLQAGRSEMDRLGRLARSQRVFPMLFTQRATDALHAGLAGYISRGLILPIKDEDEAQAALQLFKIEATAERMARVTGAATMGDREGTAWNWNSMRALRDANTGEVARGAIGLYCDLAKRAVPVEIVLPDNFLKRTSTTERDILARERSAHALAAVRGPAPHESSAALFGDDSPLVAAPSTPSAVPVMPFLRPATGATPQVSAPVPAVPTPRAATAGAGAVPFLAPAAHGNGDSASVRTEAPPAPVRGKPLW